MGENYYKIDEWKMIEEGFLPEKQKTSESLFSIGNGMMGQRANFEEKYTGQTLRGSYIAGIYYPDKTRVGWWKNGYPEYFAKVLNSVNWIGIDIHIDGEELDLAKCQVSNFHRELNMQHGYLRRSFIATLPNGKKLEVSVIRFVSIVTKEIGAIKYQLKPLNFDGEIFIKPYLDFNVVNEDSNYNEVFWERKKETAHKNGGYIEATTRKLDFQVGAAMSIRIKEGNAPLEIFPETESKEKYLAKTYRINTKAHNLYTIEKYSAIVSNFHHKDQNLEKLAFDITKKAEEKGFEKLKEEQAKAWLEKWKESDIIIEGDPKAQQGIRYNIFQLYQTYTGKDPRLNIGPKGFTGEKYGGSTYWDTEAFCFPFYLSTASQKVARNLLIYRYKHLPLAIENAKKLGIHGGAALYPMVTMNGEECHNEWEITFEEIHRNGSMAYAIYNYINHTNDIEYLAEYGLEVLIAISRYWKGRVNFSEAKNKYVILGVTGPNEYENNVNNNWYTNYLAAWCIKYTTEVLNLVKNKFPEKYEALKNKIQFNEKKETENWKDITDNIYLPTDSKKGIFLQQDGFLDKELIPVSELRANERPINQYWSWDKILRSVYIKQADVLQGIYFFDDHFDLETKKKNFDFYEPFTVHESSLSPSIHSVIASRIGNKEKAYELYLRTARLDIDDYNKEAHEGLHITSMAGTWLAVVQGFGGFKVQSNVIYLEPKLPKQWKSYTFCIRFQENILNIKIKKESVIIDNKGDKLVKLNLGTVNNCVGPNSKIEVDRQNF